jgi:hypothetical protein
MGIGLVSGIGDFGRAYKRIARGASQLVRVDTYT